MVYYTGIGASESGYTTVDEYTKIIEENFNTVYDEIEWVYKNKDIVVSYDEDGNYKTALDILNEAGEYEVGCIMWWIVYSGASIVLSQID